MAWPSTTLTTYTANTAPAIKAFDLNAFQTGINGIVNGTYDLQAVTLTTGTPGAAVTPVNGSLIAARTVFGTAVPGNTVQAGEYPRDSAPAGMGHINAAAATLRAGFGIDAIQRLGAGDYRVTFNRVPTGPSANNSVVSVSMQYSGDAIWPRWAKSLDGANRLRVDVTYPLALDMDFDITVWVF